MLIQFDRSELKEKIRKSIEEKLFAEDLPPEHKDDLNKVYDYLPEMFTDDSEEEYIRALQLATETSFENRLFQFAYVQYHMLFMTSIYYVLLKLSELHKDEFEKALFYLLKDRKSDLYKPSNTKGGKLYFGSFAIIPESDVFMLLRIVGLDTSLLGELQKRVEKRNKYAHANGQMLLTSEDVFWEEIKEYNKCLQRIFELLKKDIIKLYKDIILQNDFYDEDVRAYMDSDEQIQQEFIKAYSLSRVELNWLRKIKLSEFNGVEGEDNVKELHCALIHYYATLDEENYHPFKDLYILHKYENYATDFVENELGISAYSCVKDGGEFPVYDCPECGHNQLVYDEGMNKYHCFHCSEDFEGDSLIHCSECNAIIYKNDVELCANCIEHKMSD